MIIYTLYLNGEPLEITAADDTDARRIAGSQIQRSADVESWELRRDHDGRCLGRGKAERYQARGWRPAADSPLLGPF